MRSGARREPNTRATDIELYDGLEATSQNRWPSLRFDVQAINGLFSPLFVAGFYYKTFMWPASFWEKVYEPMIRRAAGLGRAALDADPDHYEKSWAHCDVLVIGAGPAGLAAALTAARTGARVIVADERLRASAAVASQNAAPSTDSLPQNGPRRRSPNCVRCRTSGCSRARPYSAYSMTGCTVPSSA